MRITKKFIAPALIALLCVNTHAQSSAPMLNEQNLIYTTEQMFSFNIENYLNSYAPHLAPYSETISHWAGVSSISPKILISLIEYQTSLVSTENSKANSRPFGDLSQETSFREQMRDVSLRLAEIHYNRKLATQSLLQSVESLSLTQLLDQQGANKHSMSQGKSSLTVFSEIYSRLFAEDEASNPVTSSQQPTSLVPPSSLLQLPYPVGAAWRFGGSHSNTGSGSVYSSLDLHDGGNWGDNLSNKWVKASGPGTVKIHSSCNMEVIHDGGWSTQYYHLDNIQYSNNQSVGRNQSIANYASNKNQALCEGGSSSGPHQHFSLKQNGSYVSLQGVKLSGFTVNVGTSNYDTNCNRFYLQASNGTKHCSGPALNNPGVGTDPDPDPDPTPGGSLQNGVAKTNLAANTGAEIVYTFAVPAGASNINFVMSGGTGDADMYVKFGTTPTDSSYDCRPYKSGNAETCTATQTNGTYFVRLKAYQSFSGVTLKASYSGSTGGLDPIDESVNNVAVNQGQWQRYTQALEAGYSTFTVTISGGSGDADLYVRNGAQSTSSLYDCRPYKNGNSETCTFNSPASGTWYLDLYGYSAASGITLRVVANP